MNLKNTAACLLLGLFIVLPLSLHSEYTGYKYFKNYNPEKEYDIQPHNLGIIQDKRGVIYIANNGGIVEFDGNSWRLITVPNLSAHSLAMAESGTIYAGGKDQLGYLTPDDTGRLHYVSLVGQLKDIQKKFSDVWRVHATKQGIFFRTLTRLFRWDAAAKQMRVWETGLDQPFKASFNCNGTYYIQRMKTGLIRVVNGSLELAPGGETFKTIRIYMMVDNGAGEMLIGTRTNGFYLYDGSKAVPFPTAADDYLKEKQLYHGIRLAHSPGKLALATRLGGLIIMDRRGRVTQVFAKSTGLLSDTVYYVFEDRQGNLWLAKDKGIAKIEYASAISTYDHRSNLPGLIMSVVNHRGRLYAGTTGGLFLLAGDKFQPVPGMNASCRSLLSAGDYLITATSAGVFQAADNETRRILPDKSFALLHSRYNPGLIWAGTHQGPVSLLRDPKNKQWYEGQRIKTIPREIHTIAEDNNGNLWLGTRTTGAIKVTAASGTKNTPPQVTFYHTGQQLPAGEIHVFRAADRLLFASPEKGLFRFDEKNNTFYPDLTLGRQFAGGEKARGVFRIAQDQRKHIWIHSLSRNFQAVPQADGTYSLVEKPFLRIPQSQVNTIYPDPGGNCTWFAGSEGLFRYDLQTAQQNQPDYPALIRLVLVNGKAVFNGYQHNNGIAMPAIPYRDRNLRFVFAAPFFEAESKTRYRCMLEGYEDSWSAWSSESRKDYTNLDAGIHQFRVRAKNVYENISREAVFKFRILPPWYNTWWAYSLAAIGFYVLVFLVVRWRSHRLIQEKLRLEETVRHRTKEIETQKLQLENQSRQLQELDRVKSRFFANISHEFRTPLTLIMGPLEQMLSQPHPIDGRENKKKMNLMLRNSQRLLNLINQLLDLSKLESGKMRLHAVHRDVIPFLKGICATFEIAAQQKELDLQFHSPEKTLTLYIDPEKLEKIMVNLLSNAIKFTPPGGRVSVSVNKHPARDETYPEGSVEIVVSDTGIGIPDHQLPHIFNHFYQVEESRFHEDKYKGSGIGLALTKELAQLHHGRIDAGSNEGEESGSRFTLRLPLGATHLRDNQIAVDPEQDQHEPTPPPEQDILHEPGTGTPPPAADLKEEEKNIILVVEDSADVREYLRCSLEPRYRVAEAPDGKEGMAKAREIVPDLIISDIVMPGADGYELCETLKKDVNTSHIPIILLTARATEENLVQGLQTGADDYITKPFNTRILLARIKNLIELRSQLHLKVKRQMTLQPSEITISAVDRGFMKELQDIIETNLGDPDFNVAELSKKLYMSRVSLYRKVMALCGESPTEFIKSYRLKRAAQLFKDNFGSVTEVAFEVGFASRTYFTKCFKERFNHLPSDYLAGSISAAD